jgi:hypothetical protein
MSEYPAGISSCAIATFRTPQEPQKCMSEQILTPNSTGGGIPTPITKTNIF